MFMGTPHQGGSGVALGKLIVNVASVFMAADDRLLQHLERDSEWLQQQLGQYGPISGDFVTKFAFEEYATPTVLGGSMVVSRYQIGAWQLLILLGCAPSVRCSARRCEWRADRDTRRPHQHGQVRVEGGSWIQDGVGPPASNSCERE
jgi:hypothetical protein